MTQTGVEEQEEDRTRTGEMWSKRVRVFVNVRRSCWANMVYIGLGWATLGSWREKTNEGKEDDTQTRRICKKRRLLADVKCVKRDKGFDEKRREHDGFELRVNLNRSRFTQVLEHLEAHGNTWKSADVNVLFETAAISIIRDILWQKLRLSTDQWRIQRRGR